MLLGVVSNVWGHQLESGTRLETLVAQADRCGYRAVELRQGFLGRYETAETHLPQAEALSRLAAEFPQTRFNIAVCAPVLNGLTTADETALAAGLLAAQAVCGTSAPHLRVVDLQAGGEDLRNGKYRAAEATITSLARRVSQIGGILSLENALLPWPQFRAIFDGARAQLATDEKCLRLCYDPANLLVSDRDVDPAEVTASLSADELSMIHFKQRLDGRIHPALRDGDLDWVAQFAALDSIGYDGIGLFEVASHKRLWEFLRGSEEYLKRLGLRPRTDPT